MQLEILMWRSEHSAIIPTTQSCLAFEFEQYFLHFNDPLYHMISDRHAFDATRLHCLARQQIADSVFGGAAWVSLQKPGWRNYARFGRWRRRLRRRSADVEIGPRFKR